MRLSGFSCSLLGLYCLVLGFLAVTVKGGISLRNGMWHGLRNDIIMRNVNFQHVLETEIIANEPSGRRRSDGEAAVE